jgi:Ca2+-binding RTX toxin-like protein
MFGWTISIDDLTFAVDLASRSYGGLPGEPARETPYKFKAPPGWSIATSTVSNQDEAVLIRDGREFAIGFRGTDTEIDRFTNWPLLLSDSSIIDFDHFLDRGAAIMPGSSSLIVTGHSLGGALTGSLAKNAADYGPEYVAATYITFASPTLNVASSHTFQFGFSNDLVYGLLSGNGSSIWHSTKHIILFNQDYVTAPIDSRSAHSIVAYVHAVDQLGKSKYLDLMNEDSWIIIDGLSGGKIGALTPLDSSSPSGALLQTHNLFLLGSETGDRIGGDQVAPLIDRSGNDVLIGGQANDHAEGFSGRDRLEGRAGNDWLDGGDGLDTLNGGFGNDRLSGNAGLDVLTGGFGSDRFIFDLKDAGSGLAGHPGSKDIIKDFRNIDRDKIAIDTLDADPIDEAIFGVDTLTSAPTLMIRNIDNTATSNPRDVIANLTYLPQGDHTAADKVIMVARIYADSALGKDDVIFM